MGELLLFRVVEFRILFRGNFERVLSVHPTSSFREQFKIEGEGEGREAHLKLFSCHNLIVKGGIPQAHFVHVVFHA